ncbi:MAG TPA: hypothetical protein VN253_08370 [Kofleriaceae bacterium]|nr:hypothetical protein [Kofleriaceae bacterium]
MLVCAGAAHADDLSAVPPHVAPFVGQDDFETGVHAVMGAFGPAKDTTVVVTYSIRGAGSFKGFALVPDAKAKHGQRQLPLPKLPVGSTSGDMKTALVANLDKDADDELVIQLQVQKSVSNPNGGYSYSAYEYIVLDWDGKKFVRLAGLEKKLDLKAQGSSGAELTEEQVRAVLGVAKKH